VITREQLGDASRSVRAGWRSGSYATGDFIDRHGYSPWPQSENSEWSIRNANVCGPRALRFENTRASKPKQFVPPAMDIT